MCLRTYNFNELNNSSIRLKFGEYRGSFTSVILVLEYIASSLSVRCIGALSITRNMPSLNCRTTTNSIQSSNTIAIIDPQYTSSLSRQPLVVIASRYNYRLDLVAPPQSLYSVLISEQLNFLYPVRSLLELSSTQHTISASIYFIRSTKSARSIRFCLRATLSAFFYKNLRLISRLLHYFSDTLISNISNINYCSSQFNTVGKLVTQSSTRSSYPFVRKPSRPCLTNTRYSSPNSLILCLSLLIHLRLIPVSILVLLLLCLSAYSCFMSVI